MEDEGKVSGSNGSSYWLDACEDISCDLISDFVDFDAPIVQESVENASNQDFFGGIDHILDSIKNGGGLPPVDGNNDNSSVVNGNGTHDSIVGGECLQNEPPTISKNLCEKSVSTPNGVEKNGPESKGQDKSCDNSGSQLFDHPTKDNGVHREEKRSYDSRDRGLHSEERGGKRARTNGCKSDGQYSSRGQYCPRDRERFSAKKRVRDWDETDRRDREPARRRENYNGNRRDGRDREARGYWERDRSGSNEMVFRLGAWEADQYKGGKAANEKSQESNGDMEKEKKVEQPKEKILEEQARQYQLDVLEQAKRKNTIAFLETGAGKTLIAVLLMKSICEDLQKQNRKMLSVFLVPKVPLVYQVAKRIYNA
ncbi:hypothetical protein COLO4_23065 [Corchorus olitorius]|uniref:Helicase/UvrB N-terminal domain-containing protein n=1 Tax=Corchorus olitorius TaxID=93759 RepID=A0A1R3IIG8_9ROSI|nr:hypothetical protein COLO4_23065 [Corchorus olitorius]